MAYKGKNGKIIEKYLLKTRYNFNCCPKNRAYDLTRALNKFNFKNVSIKSSKSNTIYCSSIFNFLNSIFLDLIIVSYKTINQNIKICNYYLFSNLDSFFINLNNSLDLVLLQKLDFYVKSLKYPFSNAERQKCHLMSKVIVKKKICGFRVNVKLSRSNKRLQCSLKLKLLIKEVEFEELQLKTLFKVLK
jgi:hypothetical protein